MEQYDVYISYSKGDIELALQAYVELNGLKISCFMDRQPLGVGENYAATIQSALLNSKYVLFIYGDRSEDSIYQRRELDLALECGKKVITLLPHTMSEGVTYSIITKRTICHPMLAGVCKYIHDEIRREAKPIRPIDAPCAKNTTSNVFKRIGCAIFFFLAIVLLFLTVFWTGSPNFRDSAPQDCRPPGSAIDSTSIYDPSQPVQKETVENEIGLIGWLSVSILFLGIIFIILMLARKKKNVKLSSDVNARISIDGHHVAEINAGNVYATYLRRGEYLIDFHSEDYGHNRMVHKISDKGTHVLYSEFLDKREIKFRCFIAGSVLLSAERNALEATVSRLYNKWETEHFRISSHTFEDFNRDVVPGGQQKLYDTFIEEDANWCVFIIADGIGEKTLGEYRVAMNSFHKNGHPRILFLASSESANDEVLVTIKKEIDEAEQYWNTYNNQEHMQSIFKDCVEWDITLLSKAKARS